MYKTEKTYLEFLLFLLQSKLMSRRTACYYSHCSAAHLNSHTTCSDCTSYPKVMAMMVMSKPKKASSFLKPAEEMSIFIHRLPESSQAEPPTVFVQEEEEESVDNGDEDSAPKRDPARKDTFSLHGLSRAPRAPLRSTG